MRKIFSQIFSKNYVTRSPTTEVPKVRHNAKPATKVSLSSTSTTPGTSYPVSRSIGTIPASSTSPPIAVNIVPPLLSTYPVPQFLKTTHAATKPDFDKEVPSQYSVETERRRRSHYSSLLESSVDIILTKGRGVTPTENDRNMLISDLNVKRVLSKNEEMKKVIFKVAAMALAQNEEIGGSGPLHPFIITAGEVFFGASYNEMELGEKKETIQDILTPGILVLMLNTLFTGDKWSTVVSNKHMLLAKALVETSAGYLIHRTVQETNHLTEDTPENSSHFERMHQGNKLATLTGDLLVVSLIKNVACTGNNQVLELVMNSLSEFSTTEIAKRKPFEMIDNHTVCKAMKPKVLAESIVFAKGFQSSLMLSGIEDPHLLECAAQFGAVTGLLWKTNFDWMKLTSLGKRVENIVELNEYLSELKAEAEVLMNGKFIPSNHPVTGMMRHLIHFWGTPKYNFMQ